MALIACIVPTHELTDPARKSLARLAPNPSTGLVEIQLLGGKPLKKIEIFNIQGQKLLEFDGSRQELNLTTLTPGIYIFHLISANCVVEWHKFLKL